MSPADVHAVLRRRAAAAHQSLQEYLLAGVIEASGELPLRRAELALSDLVALPLERVGHRSLLRRCWELRENLTIYDASYVALAEAAGAVLVTAGTGCPGLRGSGVRWRRSKV